MVDDDAVIYIFRIQLCKFIASSESKVRRALGNCLSSKRNTKQKRSETPTKDPRPCGEARYTEQEDKVAKRTADHDIDHEDTSLLKSLLEYTDFYLIRSIHIT